MADLKSELEHRTDGMDILYLLDRLEETLTTSPHVPFTSRSLIDEQEALDILDQIRLAIPEEVKQARRLVAERDSILAEATEEAARLSRQAETEWQQRLDEHALARDAERRAEEVREQALRFGEQIRHEAEHYSYLVLNKVRAQLQALLEQVERGMRSLEVEAQGEAEHESPREASPG